MKKSTSSKSSFTMPAEFAPHSATIVIWCEREGSWPYGATHAHSAFANVIKAVAEGEKVYVVCSDVNIDVAKSLLVDEIAEERVEILKIATDDCWARDIGPTFVTDGESVKGVDWSFNAWGGTEDGLYKTWNFDDAFASEFCNKYEIPVIDAKPFVLEGGSICSNGNGTIITTEECLLSKGRNPELTKEDIEAKLKTYLGCKKVVWLPYGLPDDETNGHVDNMCAFIDENTVAMAWTEAKTTELAKRCDANLKALEKKGFNVVKVPMPRWSIEVTQYDCNGLTFEPGEVERHEGDKLIASYVNFYICNAGVLVPQFDDEHDAEAVAILEEAFSAQNKKIIPINAKDIIIGGGGIHCITQQIPKVKDVLED